uniref:Small ribosomal subunit protein uS15 n=1 Tax=Dermatophagoides pteronyssinus TaxID=6956 RepID=A0A6P6YBU6_DERPT|nr:40S ribosomal protein S13-1-like [Dermatophagoides pteronyssinus]
MAKMYGKGKGISRSSLPYNRNVPSWCKTNPSEIVSLIVNLAKKGFTPSQIGVALRDSHAIPRVHSITGSTISVILRKKGLESEIPENLYFLMRKAVTIRKHLDRNRADKDAKFRLSLCESKIHKLSRYYRSRRKLPANWKYTASKASAIVA